MLRIDKIKTRAMARARMQLYSNGKAYNMTYLQCQKCKMIIYRIVQIDDGQKKFHDISIEQINTIQNSKCSINKNLQMQFFCRKCHKFIGKLNKQINKIQVCLQSVKKVNTYQHQQQKQKPQKQQFNRQYEYVGQFQGIKAKYMMQKIYKAAFNKCQRYKFMFEANDRIIEMNNGNCYRRALFLLSDLYGKEDAKQDQSGQKNLSQAYYTKYGHSTKAQTSQFNTNMFKSIKNNTILDASSKNQSSKIVNQIDNQVS